MRTFAQCQKIINTWLDDHVDMWIRIEVVPGQVDVEVMRRNQLFLDVSGCTMLQAFDNLCNSITFLNERNM